MDDQWPPEAAATELLASCVPTRRPFSPPSCVWARSCFGGKAQAGAGRLDISLAPLITRRRRPSLPFPLFRRRRAPPIRRRNSSRLLLLSPIPHARRLILPWRIR